MVGNNNQQHDPLKGFYRESFIDNPAHEQFLSTKHTALLCVDIQYLDAAPGHGVFKDANTAGVPLEYQEYYFDRLKKTVLPNVRALQDCFRRNCLEVIHIRIQSYTRDGRDRSKGHKRLNLLAPPGSKEAEFLEEVAPQGDEIIINKTASGVFSSTNLHYILNNIGVNAVYVVGVYTNECVETTVRNACDLGYLVTMVEDGCATVTEKLHQASIDTLRDRYARVVKTKDAMEQMTSYCQNKP